MTPEKNQNLMPLPNDPHLRAVLDTIQHSVPSLALPPVILPDVHLKKKTEAPASFVAATKAAIVPELTAPSVGCGMGVIATSLTRETIDYAKLELFYQEMRRHLGPRYGFFKNLLLWLGVVRRPRRKYDLTKDELRNIVYRGAEAVLAKYNLPADTLGHIEYEGNVMDPKLMSIFKPSELLPRSAWLSGLHDIGYGFKGNHFLEVQYVEEIFDEEAAQKWNVKPGQILIMYHGGGGAVSHYLGRYFANRKKGRPREKIMTFLGKILFHFGSARGIHRARERWHYYITPKPFQEIPAESYEGKRLLASIQASLNYSYAFRAAIVKRVMDALTLAFGPGVESRLLWDTIHNSITKETIGGKELYVHRHTATRVFDGKPVIVSGFNTTSSYLGIGEKNAEGRLFSADHGAGETIKKFQSEGRLSPHLEKYITYIFTTKPPYKQAVEHVTDEGVNHVMDALEASGVTHRAVRLRPLAVFKG